MKAAYTRTYFDEFGAAGDEPLLFGDARGFAVVELDVYAVFALL